MNGIWSLPVFRLVATDRCRVPAPWFAWSRRSDGASSLRRLANTLERQQLRAFHPVEQALAAVLYLPLSLCRIVPALRHWGRRVRALEHVSYSRQFLQLGVCAWRFGIRPQVYYYLRLHERRWRQSWGQLIDPSELHHLQREISPVNMEPLENKLLFAHRALAHHVPVTPPLAVWQNGRPILTAGPSSLCQSLIVKRTRSYRGVGLMGFRFNPITGAHHDDQRRYSLADLRAVLAGASVGVTLLVQPWLQNHPDLAGFSDGALCNYRIVSGRHPDGHVEILLAALRFPHESRLTCAEKDVTLCAAVDLDSGRLSAATAKDPGLGRLVRHPVSGQQIEGFAVPHWPEMLTLVRQAHASWPEFPFIGWDLADTSVGPIFLEGSCLWGGFLAQMSGNPPLGLTPFAQLYRAQLEQREQSKSCPLLVNA